MFFAAKAERDDVDRIGGFPISVRAHGTKATRHGYHVPSLPFKERTSYRPSTTDSIPEITSQAFAEMIISVGSGFGSYPRRPPATKALPPNPNWTEHTPMTCKTRCAPCLAAYHAQKTLAGGLDEGDKSEEKEVGDIVKEVQIIVRARAFHPVSVSEALITPMRILAPQGRAGSRVIWARSRLTYPTYWK